jgi:glycine oxidase
MNQIEVANSQTADVVIVGGGVIGLAIARALSDRAVGRVTLLERANPGTEASWAAGGMLAVQAEADRADAFFDLAAASRDMYFEWAASLREETGVDIELDQNGTLYLAFSAEDEDAIARRFEWQTRAGLQVERLTAGEVLRLEPAVSENVRGGLRFPLDCQVENRLLLAALVSSLEKRGVDLRADTNVESLIVEKGRITGVKTSRYSLYSPIVIVAGGAWTSFLTSADSRVPPIRIEPVRGQMLCFEGQAGSLRQVLYSPRGYVVPRMNGRLLAGSTTEYAGFEKAVTGWGINTIMSNAIEIANSTIANARFADAWAGLRPRAEDRLPVIGSCAEVDGLFYATGHYRNGVLLAPVTADLGAQQIATGIAPAMLNAFSPDRFQPAAVI